MNIDYPQTKPMCDAEQFVSILAQITLDKVSNIQFNAFGPTTITFKDGSKCGGMWIWNQVAEINKNYMQYNRL